MKKTESKAHENKRHSETMKTETKEHGIKTKKKIKKK